MRSYLLPAILFIADIATIVIVAFVSLFIRFDGYIEPQYINQMVDAFTAPTSFLYVDVLAYAFVHAYLALCRGCERYWQYLSLRQ